MYLPTLSLSVYIMFYFLVGGDSTPFHYIFSPPFDAWSHALLVPGTQNMIVDLFMDGRQYVRGLNIGIRRGGRVHLQWIHWFGPWPEAKYRAREGEIVSLAGRVLKRDSICVNIVPST